MKHFSSSVSDICVAPESQGGFEREQIREQLGGFIGRFSMGRLRRFLSGIIYGNPFRAGTVTISKYSHLTITISSYSTLPVQMTEHLKSSPTLTPTWTTWWPTTTRKPPAWRMCPPPTWGRAPTPESTFSSTTSLRAPARCAAWETRSGKLFTAVWSAQPGAKSMSGCTWCPVSTSGTKRWGEKREKATSVIVYWFLDV